MVQRSAATADPTEQKITLHQPSTFEPARTIEKIDALEAQMNQQLFQHSRESGGETQGFQLTQIQPFHSTLQTTQTMAPRSQEPTTVQQAGEYFANDKALLAQNILEQAIGARGVQHDRVPTWLALFDLYRATDQMDRFEALALDFSVRFGRSSPSWVSIPEQAALAQSEHTQQPMRSTGAIDWAAPAALTQGDVQALQALVRTTLKTPRELTLDWRGFAPADPHQWDLLQAALLSLASQPLSYCVYGVAELERLFNPALAESQLARLTLLRCQNQAQAFEDAAIAYSVQFEISPPDWIKPACRFEAANGPHLPDDSPGIAGDLLPEFYGSLEAARAVKLLAEWTPFDGMMIRCDRLVRCDPIATMAITRWCEAAKAKGLQIELQGPHRLISAYFSLKKMDDYVKINTRREY